MDKVWRQLHRQDVAVARCTVERLMRYPHVDDVVALEHGYGYGCGVAIDAPDAVVPIRTLRNISLNPNFGGEVMVVSLGCEKLQPRIGFSNALFPSSWHPGHGRTRHPSTPDTAEHGTRAPRTRQNTAPDALESVIGVG